MYERQVPSAENFPDDQKRCMLENTVSLIAEMRQVNNNADREKTKIGKIRTKNTLAKSCQMQQVMTTNFPLKM
jgi:predicted GNAT family N-acyltransferase